MTNEEISDILKLFSESTTYNMADYRYSTYIKPILQHLSIQQLIELIDVIDNNPQIHNRVSSYSDNNEILSKCKHLLDLDFDFEKYYNFVFDKELIKED